MKLLIYGLLILGFLCSAAKASSLTFYTDKAAWLAAVSGYEIGSISGFGTGTLTTLETNSDSGCCEITSRVSDRGVGLPNLFYDFTQAGQRIDEFCWSIPNCTVSGTTGPLTISLSQTILGFASDDARTPDIPLTLNGEGIPEVLDSFLGVVGTMTSLDFECGCLLSDDFGTMSLGDIVVATGEPSAAACWAVSLLLITFGAIPVHRASDKTPPR